MKLQKEKSREYNNKIYFKYRINLPEKVIEKAEFKEGEELQVIVKKGEIRIKKG